MKNFLGNIFKKKLYATHHTIDEVLAGLDYSGLDTNDELESFRVFWDNYCNITKPQIEDLINQDRHIIFISLLATSYEIDEHTQELDFLMPLTNIDQHAMEHILVEMGKGIQQKWIDEGRH